MQTFAPGFLDRKFYKRKSSIQLACALNNLSKEMCFDFIRSVLFEKRLSCVFIEIQFKVSGHGMAPLGNIAMQRNHETYHVFSKET